MGSGAAWGIPSLENAHGWPADSGIGHQLATGLLGLASDLESVTSLGLQMPNGLWFGVADLLLGVSSDPDARGFTTFHDTGLIGKISQGQGHGCLWPKKYRLSKPFVPGHVDVSGSQIGHAVCHLCVCVCVSVSSILLALRDDSW